MTNHKEHIDILKRMNRQHYNESDEAGALSYAISKLEKEDLLSAIEYKGKTYYGNKSGYITCVCHETSTRNCPIHQNGEEITCLECGKSGDSKFGELHKCEKLATPIKNKRG